MANKIGTLVDAVNFNRITEDNYLEVKMLMRELAIDEEVKKQNRAFAVSVHSINTILAILELKYDEDEDI